MAVPSRIAAAVGAGVLVLLLAACIPTDPAPGPDATVEQQGPVPPANTSITLLQLATVVGEEDAPPQARFDVGEASTSGADLLSEQDYWASVGGTPEECADVVAGPYLVSSADAADPARLDDPTGAIGTFSEAEDLFGLVQVYGRVFDGDETASGFLDEFADTAAGCGGYRFVGPEGDVTYEASGLRSEESAEAPAGTRVLAYSEEAEGTDALGVAITFVQHENALVAIYSELYPSSTMTQADVAGIAERIIARMAAL